MIKLLLIVGLSLMVGRAFCQMKEINIVSFGAKADGITDNTEIFSKAFKYCVAHHVACFVPKKNNSYMMSGTVYIPLHNQDSLVIVSDGAVIQAKDIDLLTGKLLWKLTPTYQEAAMWAFGPPAAGSDLTTAFGSANNAVVNMSGLIFKGPPESFTRAPRKLIAAVDISADNVSVHNLRFKNLKGYGLRLFGGKNIDLNHLTMQNVGGRGKVPEEDAYGDGIYLGVLKNDARVSIKDCSLTGAVIKGRRSRSGITFEYSNHSYAATIDNCNIQRYAKAVHFEDRAKAYLKVTNCTFSDFNYAIAMVANNQSTLSIDHTVFNVSGTDGVDPGDGGPVVNTNHGGTIDFKGSTLNLNGKKHAYISMVGVKKMVDCIVNGYNKNPFLADANITFEHCRFIDFGGPGFSFFSYGKSISTFNIFNCEFRGGGPVSASGQRVNLNIKKSVSEKPLRAQTFDD